MFNYIHRIDGSTVNEVLINNQAFTEVGGGKVQHNPGLQLIQKYDRNLTTQVP